MTIVTYRYTAEPGEYLCECREFSTLLCPVINIRAIRRMGEPQEYIENTH